MDLANERTRELGRKQLSLAGPSVPNEIIMYVEDVVWGEYGEVARLYRQKIGGLRHWIQSPANQDTNLLSKLHSNNPNAKPFILSVCENRAKPNLLLEDTAPPQVIETVPTLAPDEKWQQPPPRWTPEDQWRLPDTPADSMQRPIELQRPTEVQRPAELQRPTELQRPAERRHSQEASPQATWAPPPPVETWQQPSPLQQPEDRPWQTTPSQGDRPWEQPHRQWDNQDQWQMQDQRQQSETHWKQPEPAWNKREAARPDQASLRAVEQPSLRPSEQWSEQPVGQWQGQHSDPPASQPAWQQQDQQSGQWQQADPTPTAQWQQGEQSAAGQWPQPEQTSGQLQPEQAVSAPQWQQAEQTSGQWTEQGQQPPQQWHEQTSQAYPLEEDTEQQGSSVWWEQEKAEPPVDKPRTSGFILGDEDTSIPSARPVEDIPAPIVRAQSPPAQAIQSMTLNFEHHGASSEESKQQNLLEVRETFNQFVHGTTEGRIAAHADRVHRRTVDEALLAVKSSLGQLPEISQDLSVVVGELVNQVRQREATFRSSQAEAHGLILKLQESATGIQDSVEELNDMMSNLRSDLDAAHRLLIGL